MIERSGSFTKNTFQKVLEEIEDAVYQYQKTGFFKYAKDYVDAVDFLIECQDDCSHNEPVVTTNGMDEKGNVRYVIYCKWCFTELEEVQGEFNPRTGGYDYELVIKDRRFPRLDVLKKEPIA